MRLLCTIPKAGFPRAADSLSDGISVAGIIFRVPSDAKLLVEVLNRISVVVHDELSGVERRSLALGRHFPEDKEGFRFSINRKKVLKRFDNRKS